MTQDISLDTRMGSAETPATADMVATKSPKPAHVGYRLLAALFLLLGVGGLFLGMLGRVSGFFAHIFPYFAGEGALAGSLAGYGYAVFAACFTDASALFGIGGPLASTILGCVSFLFVVLLVLAVVFSLIAFICAMASGELAKKLAVPSGVFLLLAYGGLFLWGYLQMGGAASLAAACDIPTAIVAFVLFVALAVTVIAKRKWLGVTNVILLAASFGIAFFAGYPSSLTLACIYSGLLDFSSDAFLHVAALLLTVLIAFNVFVSILRIDAKCGYVFDCARFIVLFVSVLLLLIAFIATPPAYAGSRWAIFEGKQLLYTLSFSLLTILAALVAVFGFVSHKKQAEKERMRGATESYSALFAPAPETAALPAPADYGTKTAEAPMSEFERRMQALARGEQPEPAPAEKAQHYQPAAQAQPVSSGSYFDANQYTYDPFINTLTPQEKNEFGDLFIAGKLGRIDYLPTYIIGGDNAEFFHKVFIYLGRFRKDISAELLDKLYTYVSKNG